MRTVIAVYKGNRVIELKEDIDLPSNSSVTVLLPTAEDERVTQQFLQGASEKVFEKLWDNEGMKCGMSIYKNKSRHLLEMQEMFIRRRRSMNK